METFAAVITGKGTGAISTIEIFGTSAKKVLKKIFAPASAKSGRFQTGKILLGKITDGTETIDQVTIGCLADNRFAVNCHGNPLIVAEIMQLLKNQNVKPITAEQLLAETSAKENTIAIEAKLAIPKAKTIEGTKIIANQIKAGLSETLEQWQVDIEKIGLDKIKTEAEKILQSSQTAKLIIFGCKTAITGPPNSGKSTLLNCLCGREKAIVTNISGTTRDYVTGQCQIGPLYLELIDTAGLDSKKPFDVLEKFSRRKSLGILEEADLVLVVLDNSQNSRKIDDILLEKIKNKKIITIFNKSDLPNRLNSNKLPQISADKVKISAKFAKNIDEIAEKIQQITGSVDFDLNQPAVFTARQENLLGQLIEAKSKPDAQAVIAELLNGQL